MRRFTDDEIIRRQVYSRNKRRDVSWRWRRRRRWSRSRNGNTPTTADQRSLNQDHSLALRKVGQSVRAPSNQIAGKSTRAYVGEADQQKSVEIVRHELKTRTGGSQEESATVSHVDSVNYLRPERLGKSADQLACRGIDHLPPRAID